MYSIKKVVLQRPLYVIRPVVTQLMHAIFPLFAW